MAITNILILTVGGIDFIWSLKSIPARKGFYCNMYVTELLHHTTSDKLCALTIH